jgi:dihydrofolate synthase/folylpolyglutamate synthase
MTRNLDNIRLFCNRLGNPETHFQSIHVGGTNGKGTIVATIASILEYAGVNVGMYTSPHLLSFCERIRVNGREISEEQVFAFLQEHWDFILENHCTFFEVSTAMALETFRRNRVEVAVVEVGLGGIYDATGIVQSILSVITRIDFDHIDRLGDTLEQIASDKAGIFRSGRSALISAQQPFVIDVLRDKAEKTGAHFLEATDLVRISPDSITPAGISGTAEISTSRGVIHLDRFHFPLTGSYQIENLKTALAAASMAADHGYAIDSDAMREGLSRLEWPGRLQQLREKPALVVDVGHNPGAIREALKAIGEVWQPRNIIAVFSALREKDVGMMMKILRENTAHGFIVPLPPPRGLDESELDNIAIEAQWNATVLPSMDSALPEALKVAGGNDLVLVIGSHYLVEEVLKTQKYS